MYGINGKNAPVAKKQNDDNAAFMGVPTWSPAPSDSGLPPRAARTAIAPDSPVAGLARRAKTCFA
jgi:hypothetical protein